MSKKTFLKIIIVALFFSINQSFGRLQVKEKENFQPLTYEEANNMADSVMALMTLQEKISYIGGDRNFLIMPVPRLHLDEVYMSDATQGVHIRQKYRDTDLSKYQLDKSTAFPCPISLSATWNTDLSYKYAEAVGEECLAGGIGILLGPGMNIYRQAQCGRNFEYFGEDPFLAARMIEQYVKGVQNTGTVATLKHFAVNNTDYYRRKSNSIVDERTLHEIYTPAFKAGIDAGAKAVMTSYNQVNGEWAGQSEYVINDLLKNQLGFKWMVMTDWWSVYNGEKVVKSGQDIEMPYALALKNVDSLLKAGKIQVEDINRMVKGILRTYFAMKLGNREKDPVYINKIEGHESVALQTAREGIVLLRNSDNILPVKSTVKNILLTGDYVDKLAMGGGSAIVEGYNRRLMLDELKAEFGDRINFIKEPSIDQIRNADLILCNVGTDDNEGWDRPFELPSAQEQKVMQCVNNNPNTVVIVTSGSGIRMTDWSSKAKAIIYAWYGGQVGNTALAEILSGKVNPSGKLPITIEKDFRDSPGYGYIPEGEELYTGKHEDQEKIRQVYDIHYNEGIFVGYRWFENKNIEPLFPFGHGLSYTSFQYENLNVSKEKFNEDEKIVVSFTIKNTGDIQGQEIAQLYIQDETCSVPRPFKELKGFQKVSLSPGEIKTVQLELSKKDFSFWDSQTKSWFAEKGKFILHVGSSSKDIRLKKDIEIM